MSSTLALRAPRLFGRDWKVTVSGRMKFAVTPDRVFGLEFTSSGGKPTRAFYFLEADRATMPVIRQNLSKSSF